MKAWIAWIESVLLDAPALLSAADAVRRDRILAAIREALDEDGQVAVHDGVEG